MSEWISVEDRFPNNSRVIVRTENNSIGLGRFTPNDRHSDWSLWCCCGKPTHWQPLPEPPVE